MLISCIHLYTTPTWVETSCKDRKFLMRNWVKKEWRWQRSWFPLDKMSKIIREGARQQETFLLSFVLHSVRSPSWGQIMISFPQRIGDLLDDPFLTHQSPSPSLPVGVRAPKLWARFITPRGDNSSGRRKHNFGSHHLKPCALPALDSRTFGNGFANGLKVDNVMMVIMQEVPSRCWRPTWRARPGRWHRLRFWDFLFLCIIC